MGRYIWQDSFGILFEQRQGGNSTLRHWPMATRSIDIISISLSNMADWYFTSCLEYRGPSPGRGGILLVNSRGVRTNKDRAADPHHCDESPLKNKLVLSRFLEAWPLRLNGMVRSQWVRRKHLLLPMIVYTKEDANASIRFSWLLAVCSLFWYKPISPHWVMAAAPKELPLYSIGLCQIIMKEDGLFRFTRFLPSIT